VKAGFCEADITPAVGMERPGGYGKAYIVAIHDSLKVRASVFEDDRGVRIALVGLDSLGIEAKTAARIRREASALCGIKEDNILLAASHTHSGGPIHGCFAEDYENAPELVQVLARDYSVVVDPDYHRQVVAQAVKAIEEADRRKEDALVSVGSGYEDKVAFNRRFRMKNGRVYTHPGKGNPDIIEPAGPTDPEVGVLGAWSRDGRLLGCIVNYACHGTTFCRDVSADWIYYLEQTIRGVLGEEATVVFLNGAAGDVTQVDNLSMREQEFGEKWSRFVGARVGAEAVKVLVSAERGDAAPVATARKVLVVPRRTPAKDRYENALFIVKQGLEDVKTGKKKPDEIYTTDWIFAKEILLLEHLVGREPVARVEVQAVQVGPAVFLANPAEYFCQHGLNIKKSSPFPFTFVVELANGSAGYVPTPDAFGPDGGGYETILSRYSNLPVDAGRTIEDTSVELAKSLTPGRVPPGSTTKFCGPWDYGVRGPEIE